MCTNMIIIAAFLLITSFCTIYLRADKVCCGQSGCYDDAPPFDDMPLPQCPDVIQVNCKLYTRDNQKKGQIVTKTTIPPNFDAKKRTVVITHGYLNWNDIWWMTDFKNAFLQAYDWNVIVAGWEKGAQTIDYRQAASNTRVAGKEIAAVLRHLVQRGGADRAKIWCTGHSLGSHVCGHAGHNYKIGRVTGMDPAGPWFEDKDSSVGINPNSADFVDIWHTNGETALVTGFGTFKRLGHVDFYPNGGGYQPGCIIDPYNSTYKGNLFAWNNKDYDIDPTPFCSHLRVLDLFVDSINSKCQMYARHACMDESNIPKSCLPCKAMCKTCGEICALMGIDAPKYKQRGLFYLTTNAAPPYCKG